ncbi:DUF1772 domain-containing protein [Jiangella sp. DSM 45060]|uniref:DUF1772 domain-containing protein n=1 Tax=Jiangella sp. DSM 45060 TaxID=1798224 RepID=UPI00087CAE78|nr:DUF1772 domain-containing protein [Jiangella sp. DSM 45060]SDT44974.1 protein of unknown function [Jiangella sp. DSM 45060]
MNEITQERTRAGARWDVAVLAATLLALVLVTGLNVTFAVAVMPNLAGADDLTFVTTLQRYNDNPVFPLSYTVALILTILAPVVLRRHGDRAATRWAVVTLVLYAVVVGVTAVVNLPLNEEIDAAGLGSAAGLADVRDRVEDAWAAANLVRSLVSVAAVGAVTRALVLRAAPATAR